MKAYRHARAPPPRLPADSPGPGEEEEGLAMQTAAAAPGKMAAAKSGAGGASQPA